ncbi:hypothetical protein K1719_008230 [Acacia pycnantha]|nr:hypothetical protein K1719_008230 [Acacia pycnantha]
MAINQDKVEAELFQAQAHLYKHVFNFLGSMCLKSALQLNIPDIIYSHGRPITLPELLSALQIQMDPAKSSYLYRLMRLLVHSGIFSTTKVPKDNGEEEGYDLTPSSRLLLKDNVPSLSPFVRAMFHPAIVHSSEYLGDWFSSNKPTPCQTAHGIGFWEYLNQDQEFNRLFNEDLPHVVENLQDSRNLKFIGGDMFQSIPTADVILLKLVLHAYSDEDCVKVLKKCREAIASKGKEGKVIIIDIVIDEKKDEHYLKDAKLFFDVLMMSVVTGREREEKEWEKLFLDAGFSRYKITPIFGLRSLIEVYP